MSDFSTKATLHVELDQNSLQDAREQIQDELAAQPIQVETQPVDRPGTTGGSGGSTGGAGGGTLDMLSDSMEAQSTALDGITDFWDENIGLNERRNEILEEIEEGIERGNMSGGGRGLLGTIGGIVGGGLTLGVLGASTLINFLKDFSWPKINIPDIPSEIPVEVPQTIPVDAPDSIPLDVPDIPPLDVPEIPPLDVPEIDPLTIKKPDWLPIELKKPDWIPLGEPEDTDTGTDTDTDTDTTDTPPTDIPDIPPVPQGPKNPFNDGGYDSPIPAPGPGPAPTPPGDEDTPTNNPGGSPGIVDRIVTGAATQGAITLDMLKGGAEAAGDSAGGIAAAAGTAGLAGLLTKFGPTAAGAATPVLTRDMVPGTHGDRSSMERLTMWADAAADPLGINIGAGNGPEESIDPSKLDPQTGTVTGTDTATPADVTNTSMSSSEQDSNNSGKEKPHGDASIVVQKANNWNVQGKIQGKTASDRDYSPSPNTARESSRQRVDVTVKNDVTIDSRQLRRELDGMKQDIQKDVEKAINDQISNVR